MKELRPYQREAINALYTYWQRNDSGNGVVVLPTGSGKSLVMSALIKEIQEKWGGTRILVLAHVKELIQQNYEEIKGHYPQCDIGIYSAGLNRKDTHNAVLVAGIQSFANYTHNINPPPEIVIIDECHLMPRDDQTRYNKTIKTLKYMYPHLKVVGLSATPYRLDSGWLHVGENAVFNHIVYEVKVQDLIDHGYLCPILTRSPGVKIDSEGVRHSGKDFSLSDLEAHVLESGVTKAAIRDLCERAKDRKKWLIFATGVKHAQEIFDCLESEGVKSAVITGDTPKGSRDDIIDNFKGNALEPIRALINVNVLTTGFNVPAVDCVALMRPTESVGLYVQMVGRGMRLCNGKENCLVLDYAGLTLRHGPIDAVNPDRQPFTGEGVPPAKECPDCMAILHTAIMVCPVCGHQFPESEIAIMTRPAEAPILKSQIEPTEMIVNNTYYDIHKKEGKKDSVKITYSNAIESIYEWVFPETGNQWGDFHYRKFCKAMGMREPYPRTAEDFIVRSDLKKAQRIWTIPDGKYTRVKAHEWGELATVYEDDIPF